MGSRARAALAVGFAFGAIVLASASCRSPTDVMVRVFTNAPCASLDVSLRLSAAGATGGAENGGQKGCRDPSAVPADVGTIVLVPGASDEPMTIRVMAGIGRSAQSCVDSFGKGCIAARRSLSYVKHTSLDLPILLDTQCDGLACSEQTTCVFGKCVDATVDPNGCLRATGCTTTDAGSPDVATDASPVQVAHISAKGDTTCAVLSDGSVRCWGKDDANQLGFGASSCGAAPCVRTPTAVPGIPPAKLLAVGARHACIATSAGGNVWCWGDSTSGQTSVVAPTTAPVQVGGIAGALALGAGGKHTCAVVPRQGSATNMWCWGDDSSGQLGDGKLGGAKPQPVLLPGTIGFALVVAGDDFTCGGTENPIPHSSEIVCWGSQTLCQTGTCSPTPQLTLTYTGNACDGAAAAGQHLCVYGDFGAGNTSCWGDDAFGQSSGTPGAGKIAGAGIGFLAFGVGVGARHSCAILASGAIRCWGDGSKGQRGVGPGPFVDTTLPAAAVELALGDAHTCALAADGKVYCFGDDALGQLGDGASAGRATPGPVTF